MRNATWIASALALACACDESASAEAAQPIGPRVKKAPAVIAKVMKLEKIASGFARPTFAVMIPGDARGRMLVGEQHTGLIRVLEKGAIAKAPFGTISPVSKGNEQGLLGLAFHPQFTTNKRLFVSFTDKKGDSQIVEYKVDAAGEAIDPSSRRVIASIAQPYSNHNGGHIAFNGGKLWAGMGDGGAANDPHGHGQNRKTLLGKMLRFDVEAAKPVAETVHLGVRNPWRFAFDNNDLYIADVGQNKWEYVFAVPSGATNRNFGWNVVEGSHCFEKEPCKRIGFTPPVVEYDHNTGCSITGGVVYRGKAFPALAGHYFFADFCTNLVRSFRWTKGASSATASGTASEYYSWNDVLDPNKETLSQISSFGIDGNGELLVISLRGSIFRIAPR